MFDTYAIKANLARAGDSAAMLQTLGEGSGAKLTALHIREAMQRAELPKRKQFGPFLFPDNPRRWDMRSASRGLVSLLAGIGLGAVASVADAHTGGSDLKPYVNYVSCWVTTNTTRYTQGQGIKFKLFCQNRTDRELIIRATFASGIGIAYGHDSIWGTNGSSFYGPAVGAYSDLKVGGTLCGSVPSGELTFDSKYVRDNGYTIRIPAGSTVKFGSGVVRKIGTQCSTIPAGNYVIEIGLHRVETSGGVFKDIFMSAPFKITPPLN